MAYCCINQHPNQPGNIQCIECGSLVAGALIGDYRVISYVGSGSSSDVYLAEQHSLNLRKVVIKVLHRSCNRQHVDNFQREAALLASLSHPYILPIFSYGVIYERQVALQTCLPYFVMPYAEQGSLAESFKRGGNHPWSLEHVVSLSRDVAEALDYAHSHNVLHRDVKPANLLQMGSHVLLSDFSIASLIDADSSHLSVGWAGSPGYMAPEVWGLHPGRYSDQYALAVTCFYLLTGNYPLRKKGEGNARSWQHLHSFVAPSPLSEFRADLPLTVDFVLQRALAKNPHERYPTVQAFATDLHAASQDITQQLTKVSRIGLAEAAQFRPSLRNVQIGGSERQEVQHVGVSLANTPAPDPIVMPAMPQFDQVLEKSKNIGITVQDIHAEALDVSRHSNNWIRYSLLLNLLICLVLAAEYSWQAGGVRSGAELLLALCPALVVGPLLARLFRRVQLATFSWSLFWGVFFGLTNAFLSALVCLMWKAFLYVIPFWGNASGSLEDFFKSALTLELIPGIVALTLLALWMSVIGGAFIGIFSLRDEGITHRPHEPQK
jgi:serine/threonine protein kinase